METFFENSAHDVTVSRYSCRSVSWQLPMLELEMVACTFERAPESQLCTDGCFIES